MLPIQENEVNFLVGEQDPTCHNLRSCMLQWRLKIPQVATKTQYSQINKYFLKSVVRGTLNHLYQWWILVIKKRSYNQWTRKTVVLGSDVARLGDEKQSKKAAFSVDNEQEFLLFHILTSIWCGPCLEFGHSKGCIVFFFFFFYWCIVLIRFSLMTCDMKYIFLCLLAMYLYSLVRCLFRSLTQFLIRLLVFLLLGF